MALMARFRVIFQSTRKHFRSIESDLGIGGAQLFALSIIDARPKLGITALAEALMVRQPTASDLGDGLVRLGLVKRTRNPRDQRAVELRTTAKAKRLLARAPSPVIGVLADALASLDSAERARIAKALDTVLDGMKIRDDDARFRLLSSL
jgi:DNA-binding MarR family transcriptional regulator